MLKIYFKKLGIMLPFIGPCFSLNFFFYLTIVDFFFFLTIVDFYRGFPHSSVGKESACSAGDLGLIPGWERSSGEGNGNPLQYSCLENPIDRGAWQATVHGIARVGHNLATKPPLHS